MSQFFRPLPLSVAALALSLAVPALAQAPALACGADHGPSRLAVWGEGQARIAPDLATVHLGVTTQADSATEAMRQNASQQNAVIEALRGAGLADADIQTSGLNLSPLMDYRDGQAPRVTGYQASNVVAIRVTELAGLGGVLDAIVEAGANEIRGIEFSRENGLDAVDEARRDAVADARRKAEILAEAAGLTLGPVLSLRDQPRGHDGPRPMMRMEAAMDNVATPVQPGELTMQAAVEIEYALIGDGACTPLD